MKKIITLTESELTKIVGKIVENSQSLSEYEDEDFVDVFMMYFRPWVKSKHGDEVDKYPMSYLLKKHIMEFAKENGVDEAAELWRGNLRNAIEVGKELVKKGIHQLPSLRKEEKFTERFKKPLEYFIQTQLKLPDSVKLVFEEENPYKVVAHLQVDWEKFITEEGDELHRVFEIENQLQKFISSYLGVDFGNIQHGELSLNFENVKYVGLEDFVKNKLNKVIKKKIKEFPNASEMIRAVSFKSRNRGVGGNISLMFKGYNTMKQIELKKELTSLLQNMGYNTKRLTVGG